MFIEIVNSFWCVMANKMLNDATSKMFLESSVTVFFNKDFSIANIIFWMESKGKIFVRNFANIEINVYYENCKKHYIMRLYLLHRHRWQLSGVPRHFPRQFTFNWSNNRYLWFSFICVIKLLLFIVPFLALLLSRLLQQQ